MASEKSSHYRGGSCVQRTAKTSSPTKEQPSFALFVRERFSVLPTRAIPHLLGYNDLPLGHADAGGHDIPYQPNNKKTLAPIFSRRDGFVSTKAKTREQQRKHAFFSLLCVSSRLFTILAGPHASIVPAPFPPGKLSSCATIRSYCSTIRSYSEQDAPSAKDRAVMMCPCFSKKSETHRKAAAVRAR